MKKRERERETWPRFLPSYSAEKGLPLSYLLIKYKRSKPRWYVSPLIWEVRWGIVIGGVWDGVADSKIKLKWGEYSAHTSILLVPTFIFLVMSLSSFDALLLLFLFGFFHFLSSTYLFKLLERVSYPEYHKIILRLCLSILRGLWQFWVTLMGYALRSLASIS